MRITAFNGAMRGQRSISHLMLETFLAGAADEGAQTEEVILKKLTIKRCRACLICWVKTPGTCFQKDDMAGLLEKYMASDVVVIASPVYVDNVTGLTKDFMDRLIPLTDPRFCDDGAGGTCHVRRHERYPGIVAMSNSGYAEPETFDTFRLLFRRIARNMNADLAGEIYRSQGGLLGLEEEMLKPLTDPYLEKLRAAGAELARTGRISEETSKPMEEPLVPAEIYNQQVNALWERLMKQGGNG